VGVCELFTFLSLAAFVKAREELEGGSFEHVEVDHRHPAISKDTNTEREPDLLRSRSCLVVGTFLSTYGTLKFKPRNLQLPTLLLIATHFRDSDTSLRPRRRMLGAWQSTLT